MTDTSIMRQATEIDPTDAVAWVALADALEADGKDCTVERMTARALAAMQALGEYERGIDWIDWLEDGSAGIGAAQDRSFLWSENTLAWTDGDSLGDEWEVWKNGKEWEWACGRETHYRWTRLWAMSFWDGEEFLCVADTRGVSLADLEQEFREMLRDDEEAVRHGIETGFAFPPELRIPLLANRVCMFQTGDGDIMAISQWYHRNDAAGEWEFAH